MQEDNTSKYLGHYTTTEREFADAGMQMGDKWYWIQVMMDEWETQKPKTHFMSPPHAPIIIII